MPPTNWNNKPHSLKLLYIIEALRGGTAAGKSTDRSIEQQLSVNFYYHSPREPHCTVDCALLVYGGWHMGKGQRRPAIARKRLKAKTHPNVGNFFPVPVLCDCSQSAIGSTGRAPRGGWWDRGGAVFAGIFEYWHMFNGGSIRCPSFQLIQVESAWEIKNWNWINYEPTFFGSVCFWVAPVSDQ